MVTASILTAIVVSDLLTRRIPNIFLVLLIISSVIEFSHPFKLIPFLITIVSVSLFGWISQCGAGDVKLTLVILNLLIPAELIVDYLLWLVILSSLLIVIHGINHRSFKGNLAFAPALCGAVLAAQSWRGF